MFSNKEQRSYLTLHCKSPHKSILHVCNTNIIYSAHKRESTLSLNVGSVLTFEQLLTFFNILHLLLFLFLLVGSTSCNKTIKLSFQLSSVCPTWTAFYTLWIRTDYNKKIPGLFQGIRTIFRDHRICKYLFSHEYRAPKYVSWGSKL